MNLTDLLSLQTEIDSLTARLRDIESQSAPVAARLVDPFLSLPGLVGFWPMSSVQRSTGNAYDLSGQGRTLTYNGNPTYNLFNGFAPYIDLDGTGDFLSRADETDLDILGTEAIYASAVRGLTMGGWFRAGAVGGANGAGLITKLDAGTQSSYALIMAASGTAPIFYVSGNGTALVTVASSVSPGTGNWFFVVGRYTPATKIDVFVNGVVTTNTTSIPASLFNSTTALNIGQYAGANLLTGQAASLFLCANAAPDAKLTEVFSATRRYFGV